MKGKSYFKNVLSEAEDMYSNASGRRSAFRGQTGELVSGCTDPMAINFDPKGKDKRKRRGMRSATGGGKRSVGTAVNWLTSLI